MKAIIWACEKIRTRWKPLRKDFSVSVIQDISMLILALCVDAWRSWLVSPCTRCAALNKRSDVMDPSVSSQAGQTCASGIGTAYLWVTLLPFHFDRAVEQNLQNYQKKAEHSLRWQERSSSYHLQAVLISPLTYQGQWIHFGWILLPSLKVAVRLSSC